MRIDSVLCNEHHSAQEASAAILGAGLAFQGTTWVSLNFLSSLQSPIPCIWRHF
jgi:hypothetical protein